ncbi:MAG: carboxypeptidase regulatory-like domain-containing protein, partial [Ignavibacteria bacterium]|nr:carboxypeptidase regulatory-like domain-containing protein [Ignavibacteria bacterium]
MKSIKAIVIILLMLYGVIANAEVRNFSVSAGSVYLPGEEVVLDFYSYGYGENEIAQRPIKVKFTVFEITDPEKFFSSQASSYVIDLISKDTISLLGTVKKTESFTRTFTPKNEYGYFSINAKVDLKVRDKAAYLVRAVSGNSIAYCGFIISGMGVISKAGSSTMAGFAADRTTGKALNADFSFYAGTKKLGSMPSNEGTALIQFNPADIPADDARPLVFAYAGGDMAVSDPYFFFGYSDTRYETYIFTEQPVYRAGSTVNFKGTFRSRSRSGYMNVPGKEVAVTVKDDKGAEIYKELKQTNEIGSFDGTLILDEEARTGDYRIEVQFEGGVTAAGNFKVEQFKKPEYKVNVTAEKSRYYGDEVLNAKVSADYYFGSPVTQADVNYEIHRVRYYRPWWMFSPYADWYRDYYEDNDYDMAGAELIHTGEGKLDADGNFGISFAINEDFKEQNEFDWYRPYYGNSDFKYVVVARVTDNARHSVSGSSEVFVTRGSFLLSAQSGSYLYKPGDAVMIKVNASDFSDMPVQTEFTAYVYKFGVSRFNADDKQLVKVISGNTEADGKGSVLYESPSAGSEGSYLVEVKALDDRAKEVTASTYFYISSGENYWFGSEGGDVMIVTDKDSYEEGEICKAVIVAPESDIDMYVTSETSDIIYNAVKHFKGTTATAEIPVTDEYLSGFTVSAGYIKNGVNRSASKNVIVIPKKKLLAVTIEPSQIVYKPGEEGRLTVKVVDDSGSPVSDAEVSLGIVDESIYAIAPDKTKSIDKFFYGRQRASVSTAFNSLRTSQGNSRIMTIYEKFGIGESTGRGIVKGRVADEKGLPVEAAVIMIDEFYFAARTNSAGEFSFELPAGSYRIGVLGRKEVKYDKRVSVSRDEESKVDFSVSADEILVEPDDLGILTEAVEMRSGMETDAVMQEAPRMSVKMKGNDKSSPEPTSEYAEAEVRSDFRDAIYWSPFTRTDAQGFAEVNVKYPDNLTTWRITSRVITKDTRVGQNVKMVITRKDLLVRLETPRFARENDEITVSAIIHNYLSSEKNVRFTFRSENAELISGSQSDELSVPADGEKRLDF